MATKTLERPPQSPDARATALGIRPIARDRSQPLRRLEVRTVGARALSELVLDVVSNGHLEAARELLPQAASAVATSGDDGATATLDDARSRLAYMDGAFDAELSRLGPSGSLPAGHGRDQARSLFRAELLLATDELDRATQLARAGLEQVRRHNQLSMARSWLRVLGRSLLQAGRIAEGADALEETLPVGKVDAVTSPDEGTALVALGRIALHRGDRMATRAVARLARDAREHGGPELRRQAAWILALQAMASDDPGTAAHLLTAVEDDADDAGRLPLPRLGVDADDHAVVVKIALAADDLDLARAAVAAADERRRCNPGVASIAAAAAHARGLLEGDALALAEAAKLLAQGPRRLARAAVLEDLGDLRRRGGDRRGGIEAARQAVGIFATAGATQDVARVHQQLRTLGVRRQPVRVVRPTTGWASLTDSEMAVVSAITEGLTNREAATRLYLSPHTVSMHLRHVFTKLGIRSRVELTRLAVAVGGAA